ncbi:MAG: glycosyltransferase family 2 protein [Rikenellaceae bacterium]
MKKISILIPCYNEESCITPLYKAITEQINQIEDYEWEILFVNDGSSDNTLSLIQEIAANDNKICYIDLSRNFGKECAMLAGFDYVTGDCMIIMDADLQDPPSLIPKMIEKWEEGYEDVYAKRTKRGKESWLRKKLSTLFYKILQNSSRFDILKNVGDFRLLDRICIDSLKRMRENERYTKGLFCWIGFKKCELTFQRDSRISGESKWNYSSLFELAIEGITSFTTSPLRISTYIGFLVSIFSFVYMCYFLIKTFIVGDEVQGFPTLIVVILFLGGVQLISLGIIGEYLGRIFNETKQRPTYFVREYKKGK